MLLTHLESKVQLQLSKFQEENIQMVEILRTKAFLKQCLGDEDVSSVTEVTISVLGEEMEQHAPHQVYGCREPGSQGISPLAKS